MTDKPPSSTNIVDTMHPMRRRLIPVVVALLSMLGPFTIDTMLPAFSSIQTEFSVTESSTQQLISMYLVGFAAVSIVYGPLSDAVGRKPVIVVSLIAYVAATLVGWLTQHFEVLLISRLVQGMCAGGSSTVTRVIVRDLFSGAAAQRMMSTIMMLFGLAPAIAPIVGGFIVENAGWRAVFGFLLIFGAILITAAVLGLPESLPKEQRQPLRVTTLSRTVWDIMKNSVFQRITWVAMLAFQAFFIYVVGAAIIVVDLFGLGAADFWQLFVPLISGFVIGAFASGRLATKVTRTALTSGALLIGLTAAIINTIIAVTVPTNPAIAMICPAIIAACVSALMPVNQLITLDLFPNSRGSVSSVTTFQTLVLNAALAGVFAERATGHLWHVAALGVGTLLLATILWFLPRVGARTVAHTTSH